MAITHNLGFPRIGKQRELKFALEAYWQGKRSLESLIQSGSELRQRHWAQQSQLDWVPVGDFSFYDHMLDMSFTLGNLPERVHAYQGQELDNYFRVARGRAGGATHDNDCCHAVSAGEMTKWFDTNYHYIVPEFQAETRFSLNASRLLQQLHEARQLGVNAKPIIIGPLTYLALGKTKDDSDKLALLDSLLPVYAELLAELDRAGATWVQVDEPILVTELAPEWQEAFRSAYEFLSKSKPRLLLTTYFGRLAENLSLVSTLPVAGLHVDATRAQSEIPQLLAQLSTDQVLSLGVVDGRNIWKSDLNRVLDELEPIAQQLGDRLWIAPSCSLLHVPTDLELETELDPEVRSWLSFAVQRLEELQILGQALNEGRAAVSQQLQQNRLTLQSRKESLRVHNPAVKASLAALDTSLGNRQSPYEERAGIQSTKLNLPLFPTTTIGSFPQTEEIRRNRRRYKAGELDEAGYRQSMQAEIERCIRKQEALGLDVLVHGEAERNDMVEYFGEQLEGFAFSRHGWVQSYGSRCVKPPILFGDVSRPHAMTVEWTQYAQSLTDKPVKGMLTGPVTILNWSFVRDDQPRSETCRQIALAIRKEVQDLEAAGVHIIQIDEAALREGLPLRQTDWEDYLNWAVNAYRIAANGVEDSTQIHTHMCYSEFNDIIESIAHMDADVITIETSRSDMELLQAFDDFSYPNDIGPGVYDIHSPNIPSTDEIIDLIQKAASRIPVRRLWINPDCGLKTRKWEEVTPALRNLVAAAQELRQIYYRS